jgi:hypothetical protein
MKDNNKLIADRYEYIAYKWGQIIFVPHYRNSTTFVGPGYPELAPKMWEERELIAVGAQPIKLMLWSRPRFSFGEKEL